MKQKYIQNEQRVRIKLTAGNVTNPYDKEKEKRAKKKKKQKNPFQALIEKIFIICENEVWNQRNLDRHKPKNKSNYAAVIKTNCVIKKLYGLYDEVRAADIDLFFKTDINKLLEHTLSNKKKWIVS